MMGLTRKEERRRKWELFEVGLKLCYTCGRTLPLSEFYKSKSKTDGLESCCKECRGKLRPNAGKRKKRTAERRRLYALELKKCASCEKIKALSEFTKDRSRLDGLDPYCRLCARERSRRGNTGVKARRIAERQELQKKGLKRCSTCKRALPIEEFYAGLPHTYDGRVTQCRECMTGYTGEVKRRQEERLFLAHYKLKRCCKCKFIFPYEHFWKNAATSDGLMPTCKDCFRTSQQLKGTLEYEFRVAEREELARLGKKRCNRCNEVKPISEFGYLHCTWDKRNVICRSCSSEKLRIACKKNPNLITQGNQRRRAREAGVPATLTDEEWEFAKGFFDYRCCYCNQKAPLQREHFVPLGQGGPYSAENIIPACISCNSSKRNLLFDEWANGRGSTRVILGAREKIYEYLQLVAERR